MQEQEHTAPDTGEFLLLNNGMPRKFKVQQRKGSFQITIPKQFAEEVGISKGDILKAHVDTELEAIAYEPETP